MKKIEKDGRDGGILGKMSDDEEKEGRELEDRRKMGEGGGR